MNILQHLVPHLEDLDNRLFVTMLEFIVKTCDGSMLSLLLDWARTRPELSATCLQSINHCSSKWLQVFLSGERPGDLPNDPVLSSILGSISGKASLESIRLERTHPNRLKHADMVIDLLLEQQHYPPPLSQLCSLLDLNLSKDQMTRLTKIIVQSSLMKPISETLASCPEFNQVSTWLTCLIDMNPLEAPIFLENCVEHDDAFWIEASQWLSQYPACLKHISAPIVSRITALEAIPPAFLIRAAIENCEISRYPNGVKEFRRFDLTRLSHDQKRSVFLSWIHSAMTTTKPSKLAFLYSLVVKYFYMCIESIYRPVLLWKRAM